MRIFIILIVSMVLGCAGGSRGTGGQRIEGVVLINNQKVSLSAGSGINVTILENGDSAPTDQNGNFLIETSGISGDFTFLLEREDFEVQSVVTGFEPNPSNLRVRVIVTLADKPSAQTSIVNSTPKPTPKPTKTPEDDDDSDKDDSDDTPGDDSNTDDDSSNDDDSDDDDTGDDNDSDDDSEGDDDD